MLRKPEEIDLTGIKLAVFDYDFTLAEHRDKDYVAHWQEKNGSRGFFREAYLCPETFYEEDEICTAPAAMQALVAYLRKRGVKLICLSAMQYTLHARAKQCFLQKHYGDGFGFLTCAAQEQKTAVLQILQDALDLRPEELLFVDDLHDNVERANECGFMGVCAEEVGALPGI